MTSRYARVAVTYVRRWPIVLVAVVALAYGAALYGLTPHAKPERLMHLAGLMWLTAWATGTIAAHVKQQLADARAVVTPRYRAPHLLIGALAMALACIVLPIVAAPRLGFSTAAVMGMALVVAASTAWFVQLQNLSAGLVCNVLWLSLLNRRVVFALGAALEGDNPALAAGLITLGLGALALLWIRLARMHEGMPEFGRRSVAAALVGPGDAPTAPAPAGTIDPWFESMLRRPVKTRAIAAAKVWTRVHHVRATGLGRMPWLIGAALCGSMLALPLLVGDDNAPGIESAEPFIIMSMILPTVLTITHWGRRWPSLGYESLRPASRQRFVRELGLTVALDLAEAWAVVTAAALFVVATQNPSAALDLITGGFLLLSAATSLVVFGLNAWVLHLRSTPLTAIVLALTGLAPVAPMVARRVLVGTGWIAPLAAGLLVVGALVTLDAYGRWCRADLE